MKLFLIVHDNKDATRVVIAFSMRDMIRRRQQRLRRRRHIWSLRRRTRSMRRQLTRIRIQIVQRFLLVDAILNLGGGATHRLFLLLLLPRCCCLIAVQLVQFSVVVVNAVIGKRFRTRYFQFILARFNKLLAEIAQFLFFGVTCRQSDRHMVQIRQPSVDIIVRSKRFNATQLSNATHLRCIMTRLIRVHMRDGTNVETQRRIQRVCRYQRSSRRLFLFIGAVRRRRVDKWRWRCIQILRAIQEMHRALFFAQRTTQAFDAITDAFKSARAASFASCTI
mmetsp:Transcript_20960/g.33588  ORF Transcript_20960/g.33588 Transcript_20960/m.33588 type:complete len:279 (+) Transcript_20960:390-1226(+)